MFSDLLWLFNSNSSRFWRREKQVTCNHGLLSVKLKHLQRLTGVPLMINKSDVLVKASLFHKIYNKERKHKGILLDGNHASHTKASIWNCCLGSKVTRVTNNILSRSFEVLVSTVRQTVWKWRKLSTAASLPARGHPVKMTTKVTYRILSELHNTNLWHMQTFPQTPLKYWTP